MVRLEDRLEDSLDDGQIGEQVGGQIGENKGTIQSLPQRVLLTDLGEGYTRSFTPVPKSSIFGFSSLNKYGLPLLPSIAAHP